MEDTWPSAVARKLRMKRNEPGGTSDWSGCGTMDGLNNAAASSEYSCVKYPAQQQLPFFGQSLAIEQIWT